MRRHRLVWLLPAGLAAFILLTAGPEKPAPNPPGTIHGDDHTYSVDHPLLRRTTGSRLMNLTRLEVPGSPRVGWVRVVVRPGAADPFAFDEHVVPRWKYW
jgi:hypothetical protein